MWILALELILPPIYSSHLVHRNEVVICACYRSFLRTVLLFALIQSFPSIAHWIDSHNNFFIFPLRKWYQYALFLVKFHFFQNSNELFFWLSLDCLSLFIQHPKFHIQLHSFFHKCENISSSISNYWSYIISGKSEK